MGFSFVGSGTKISAGLFAFLKRCRSMQLYEKFNFPPLNHLKYGSFSSYVVVQGSSQSSPSLAILAQNFIGFLSASL